LAAILLGSAALSACANTRLYSEAQLSEVARGCGVAQGEVVQEPEHPRFLFLYAAQPSREQLSCVRRWSRQRRMHLAYIEAIEWVEETNAQAN
jgi:hypothetical protein